jgi:hypothetical protein
MYVAHWHERSADPAHLAKRTRPLNAFLLRSRRIHCVLRTNPACAGSKLKLAGVCTLIVTDVEASTAGYIVAFTLQALTDAQRGTLVLNDTPVSYFTFDMLRNIEVGGSLTAHECLSPLTVSAFQPGCILCTTT